MHQLLQRNSAFPEPALHQKYNFKADFIHTTVKLTVIEQLKTFLAV